LAEWPKDHPHARRLGELLRTPDANYETFKKGLDHSEPAIAVNVIIGLIKVANYLLDRQIRQLETSFIQEGGLRERMTRARLNERNRQAALNPRSKIRP
jgi:four helix bundle suffix protein